MKKIYLSIVLSLLFSFIGLSQTAVDAAVQISASVQVLPPAITLNWITTPTSTQYTIFRKLKSGTFWTGPVATLAGTTTSFVDNTVSAGISYEYKISRAAAPTYTVPIYGFINAGIEVPAIEDRGKLILMIDSSFVASLSNEIKRLQNDLEGDGWTVLKHYVLNTGSVTHVKSLIVSDYNLDPINTKALFVFGHVPVPYSGNINPDGHPDHLGAWPTDSYYGDINGTWTDISVTSTTVSPARTQNVPGDGKFDQSVLPSGLELQVGRVDFRNMPTFTLTEMALLKNYLDKDHDYRKKVFTVTKQAVVDDNFGYMSGEAFAASGYNNFAPMVGPANILTTDYFATMTGTTSCLWSYGTGPGSYNSAGGIGTTANFATSNLQGVFTMLFGSYFGDWDSQDNFLRAPLAQGKILTNVWSGRPHVQFHHMALGENIGYGIKLTQNYQGPLYYPNIYGITGNWVHMGGLMGDPTLRNDIMAPVSNVVATAGSNSCLITWSPSPEPGILGYNIYMKNDSVTNYVKINPNIIAGTTFSQSCLNYPGIFKYMVRAIKLQNTPSGTYYNMSEGIADTANNTVNMTSYANFNPSVNNNTVTFTNASINSSTYSWTLNTGVTSNLVNPVNSYTANCAYTVTLISSNLCDIDTISKVVNITSSVTAVAANFGNIIAGNTVTFTNNSANATGYSWTLDNGVTSSSVNPVYTYSTNGSYTVTLIAFNECDADTITQVINNDVGLNELSLAGNSFNVYPNPANTSITLTNEGCENCTIVIFNSEGKQVYSGSNANTNLKINVSEFKRGLYLIKLTDKENRSATKKLIID